MSSAAPAATTARSTRAGTTAPARRHQPGFTDVSLYCAWAPRAEEPAELASASPSAGSPTNDARSSAADTSSGTRTFQVLADKRSLATWESRRLYALPTDGRGPFLLDELREVIPRLVAAARQVPPAGAPLYFVLHLGSVVLPRDGYRANPRARRAAGGVIGDSARQPALGDAGFRALLALVHEMRIAEGIPTYLERPGQQVVDRSARDAAYFEHYSVQRRCRGHLVLDPALSLAVDCAENDVLLLLWMAQQAAIEPGGLAAASYGMVLTRVMLWDANVDTEAALEELNHSSNAATRGQVLLNFALAGVGILLALSPLPMARPVQLVAPMLIFVLAALCHSGVALTGRVVFDWVGIALLVAGVALAVLIFVDPAFIIPLLPNTLSSAPSSAK